MDRGSGPARPGQLTVLQSVALTAGVAGVALACAALVQDSCLHAPPPVLSPVPGTPRANYCDAIHGSSPWLTMVGLAVAVELAILIASGRRTGWSVAAAVGLTVLALIQVLVAGSLESSVTI